MSIRKPYVCVVCDTCREQWEGLDTIQMRRQGTRAETRQTRLLGTRVMVVITTTALLGHGPGHRGLGDEDQQGADEDTPERQAHSLFSLATSTAGVGVYTITSSTSEWNSRRYSTTTTPAVTSMKNQGLMNHARVAIPK